MKDEPQHVANTILKIYSGFKWKLKIADRTPDEVNALIDEAIVEIKALVHPSYQLDVIQKFEQMRNRLSEFTVDGKFELPPTVTASSGAQPQNVQQMPKPNPCKCGGSHIHIYKQHDNYFAECQTCKSVGLSSDGPLIALENWNNGMTD